MSELYTSSGSPRSAHTVPNTISPASPITTYPASHAVTAVTEPGSGEASSSHTKLNNPSAAGRIPHPPG